MSNGHGSDVQETPEWWIASDGRWYPPELHPDHVAPAEPAGPEASSPIETVATLDPGDGESRSLSLAERLRAAADRVGDEASSAADGIGEEAEQHAERAVGNATMSLPGARATLGGAAATGIVGDVAEPSAPEVPAMPSESAEVPQVPAMPPSAEAPPAVPPAVPPAAEVPPVVSPVAEPPPIPDVPPPMPPAAEVPPMAPPAASPPTSVAPVPPAPSAPSAPSAPPEPSAPSAPPEPSAPSAPPPAPSPPSPSPPAPSAPPSPTPPPPSGPGAPPPPTGAPAMPAPSAGSGPGEVVEGPGGIQYIAPPAQDLGGAFAAPSGPPPQPPGPAGAPPIGAPPGPGAAPGWPQPASTEAPDAPGKRTSPLAGAIAGLGGLAALAGSFLRWGTGSVESSTGVERAVIEVAGFDSNGLLTAICGVALLALAGLFFTGALRQIHCAIAAFVAGGVIVGAVVFSMVDIADLSDRYAIEWEATGLAQVGDIVTTQADIGLWIAGVGGVLGVLSAPFADRR